MFTVAKPELDALISIIKDRGPILQARPIRTPAVAILYTDPISGERARQLFENIMRQRLDRVGTFASFVLSSVEEEGAVARSLEHLLRAKSTPVLIASTTAPAGPHERDWPCDGSRRFQYRTFPGSRGAWHPLIARL